MKKMLLPNLLRICIDTYQNEMATGRVYSPTQEEPIIFQDWGKLMVDIDSLFDRLGYPQAFQNKRTFNKEKTSSSYHYKPICVVEEDWFFNQHGELMTYDIDVKSRQFSSWQGELYNTENELLTPFSDALQLLKMIFHDMDTKEASKI